MSHIHDGVSCDKCRKNNFGGKRYKCLICFDFDLCSQCYDDTQSASDKSSAAKASAAPSASVNAGSGAAHGGHNHLSSHPMQCILTRGDYELFYGNTINNSNDLFDQQLVNYSYTCPYCGKLGLSEVCLSEHLSSQHQNSSLPEVVCPVCAVLPSSFGGDPNHLTDDLLQHINIEHLGSSGAGPLGRFNSNDEGSGFSWPSAASAAATAASSSSNNNNNNSAAVAAAAAAAALRFSRRINYASGSGSRPSTNAVAESSSSSAAAAAASNSNTSQRSSNQPNSSSARYSFQFGNNNIGSTLNPGAIASSNQPGGGGGSGSGGSASSGIGSSLSSFMRSASSGSSLGVLGGLSSAFNLENSSYNTIDPIAELLSQLTGTRRIPSSNQSASLHLQHLQAQLNRERESLQQQSAAVAAAISSRHHHHLFAGSGRNLSNAGTTTTSSSSKSQSSQQKQQQAASQQQQQHLAAMNITNAFANQILELPPTNLLFQPVSANQAINQTTTPTASQTAPPSSSSQQQPQAQQQPAQNQTFLINNRDPRLLLSKFDFGVNLESGQQSSATSNLAKLNQLKQYLFINDILLSILMKQLNHGETRNSSTLTQTSSANSSNQALAASNPAAAATGSSIDNQAVTVKAPSEPRNQVSDNHARQFLSQIYNESAVEAASDSLAQLSKLQASNNYPTLGANKPEPSPPSQSVSAASSASNDFYDEPSTASGGAHLLANDDDSLNNNNNHPSMNNKEGPSGGELQPELSLNLTTVATANLINT